MPALLFHPWCRRAVIPTAGATGTFPTDVQLKVPEGFNASKPAASQQPEADLAGSPASELPAGVQSAALPAVEAAPAGTVPAAVPQPASEAPAAEASGMPAAVAAQPSPAAPPASPPPAPAPADPAAAGSVPDNSSTPVVGIAVGAGVGSAVVLGLAAFVWLAAARRRKRRQGAAAAGSSSSGKPSSQEFEAMGHPGGYHAGQLQLAPAAAAAAVAAAQPVWDDGSNSYQLAASLPVGRPPLPPSRQGAGSVQQQYAPPAYGG